MKLVGVIVWPATKREALPESPVLVIKGWIEDAADAEQVVRAAMARWAAEHHQPEGIGWPDAVRIPTAYWEAAGLRAVEFLQAKAVRGTEILQEPDEQIIPKPEPDTKRRR